MTTLRSEIMMAIGACGTPTIKEMCEYLGYSFADDKRRIGDSVRKMVSKNMIVRTDDFPPKYYREDPIETLLKPWEKQQEAMKEESVPDIWLTVLNRLEVIVAPDIAQVLTEIHTFLRDKKDDNTINQNSVSS